MCHRFFETDVRGKPNTVHTLGHITCVPNTYKHQFCIPRIEILKPKRHQV